MGLLLPLSLAICIFIPTACSTSLKTRNSQFKLMQELTTNATKALSLLGMQRDSNMVFRSRQEKKAKLLPSLSPMAVERVRIENVSWSSKRTRETLTNRYVRIADVLFEKETGLPIRIESLWPEGVSGTRFPSLALYEARLKHTGEQIVGIPATSPKVPLHEAMRHAHGFSTAKQFIIFLVVESNPALAIPPRPVWIIHAWGCAPEPLAGAPHIPREFLDSIHEDALNHFRSIVDAETGEWCRTDSTPQPDVGR